MPNKSLIYQTKKSKIGKEAFDKKINIAEQIFNDKIILILLMTVIII